MALNIRDAKVHKLAQEVARRTGESLTRAVIVSLEERLDRLEQPEQLSKREKQLSEEEKQARIKRIKELVEEYNNLPVVDRPMEEVLYDEHGLPR